jgi:peptidyl-dipeptidase Dcp
MNKPLSPASRHPDFSSFTAADFLPAVEAALADAAARARAIKENKDAPDFENTVVPLESMFDDVSRICALLSNLSANVYSKDIAKAEEEVMIKVSAAQKAIFQDPALGQRFRSVYDTFAPVDEDDKALLKSLFQSFESSGALLDAAGQKRIGEIDTALISLAAKFNENLQAAPKQQAVLITDPSELAGLSVDDIEGLAKQAAEAGHDGKWLFIPERLLVDDWLEQAESPVFRRKIHEALNRMGTEPPCDNRPIIDDIQNLRAEYAQLLGYDSYAAFARSRAMNTDLEKVRALLDDVTAKALPKFEADMRALEKFATENGGPAKLDPWDVSFWAVKQRQALYNFDANDFAQYLELENVLKSMFSEAGHLFGISFAEKTGGYSTMHSDIRVFEVTDNATGALHGVLHVDTFARPGSKSGGAWMNVIQNKDAGKGLDNVIILNMNLPKPPAGKPALVPLGQYVTFFHEMGHSLQGLLGTNVKYRSQQGTNCPADYVEFHSMVNERRAFVRENLKKYAISARDGSTAPDSKIDALVASQAHFMARDTLKLVQNSLRDIEIHTLAPADYKGPRAVEDAVALKSPYAAHIRPYPLTRFGHLFGDAHSNYAAGYVNYLLAEVLAADGFVPFADAPYDKEQAARLNTLYRRGSGGDPAQLYRDFRGKDATPDAMLIANGIIPAAKPAQPKGPKPG